MVILETYLPWCGTRRYEQPEFGEVLCNSLALPTRKAALDTSKFSAYREPQSNAGQSRSGLRVFNTVALNIRLTRASRDAAPAGKGLSGCIGNTTNVLNLTVGAYWKNTNCGCPVFSLGIAPLRIRLPRHAVVFADN